MRLIDKLVFKDLIGPFFNGLFMFVLLVFTAGFLFQATDLLVQGADPILVLKFILYALPSIVTQTFPMAMLLAALMGFGRLSSDREAVAIFAAGISFPRAARMVFIMGAVVSVMAFAWNETVVPPATAAMYDLKREAVEHLSKSNLPISITVQRKDKKGLQEVITAIGGFDAHKQELRDVTIVKYSDDLARKGDVEAIVHCKRATSDDPRGLDESGLNWTYHDGDFIKLTPDPKTGRIDNPGIVYFGTISAKMLPASINKNFRELVHTEVNDANRESFRQLSAEIRSDIAQGHDDVVPGKEVDLYGKIALPLASMVFGVVGAALGLSTQRGGSRTVGFGVAIFIVFLYWVFYHAMFVVGKNGSIPPFLASFLADIVGAVVGIILTIRASR